MNCSLCRAYLRSRDPCPGCLSLSPDRPRTACRLRQCDRRTGPYCFSCAAFPCGRLTKLDARYRARYGMSEIENLEYIRDFGMEAFLENERRRWFESNRVFCVHDRKYHTMR